MEVTGENQPGFGEPVRHEQEEALFAGEATAERPAPPLALYRRYRPDTFSAVIGQEHVTGPLQRALANNRVNHAYLFSGPRGCGKTTSARILARALNCERGPRAEPCGECRSCRDLARGGPGSIDVIEIDAASHGGVDDARDLRERAFFAPVASRYKIYIVDEAHMVTTAGFNALLKLVEEPPPHVKFVFATTEPDKVIGTIRSRTHHYPFRLVPPRTLTDYLGTLCAAEGVRVEPAVLPLIVRAGAGSVRDSLSVLDQLLGAADESGVGYRQAASLLGYTPDSLLDEFVDAFAAGDPAGVFSCVDKVIEVGQDPRRFAEDLLRRLRDLVIVAAVPDAVSNGLVDAAPDQAERLVTQAAALGPGELTRAAEVIAAGLTDMRGTTAPRLHLELMCARVLLPGADVDDRGVHARLDRLERRLGVSGAATGESVGQPRIVPASRPIEEQPPAARPEPVASPGRAPAGPDLSPAARHEPADEPERAPAGPDRRPQSARESGPTGPARTDDAATTAAARSNPPAAPAPGTSAAATRGPATPQHAAPGPVAPPGQSASALSVTDVRRLWPEVLEEVKGRRRFTWILLSQNAHVVDVRDKTLLLGMSNPGARDSFARGGSEDVLRDAIVSVLGADFRIEAILDPGAATAPAPARASGAPSQPAPPTPPDDRAGPARPAPARPEVGGGETRTDEPARVPAEAGARGSGSRRETPPTGTRTSRDPAADDPDAGARRDDSDLEESEVSHTELLARHLGAQIIAEEEHGA